MGIISDWFSPSADDKAETFNLLRTSGVLITDIEDPLKFVYRPDREVVRFLEEHPETDTIILGCGHFIPQTGEINLIKVALAGAESPGCKLCPHPTHHKGELTIDMELGQNPDVIADGADLEIWKAIPQHRLARIINETWLPDLFEKEGLMPLLKNALKPGGEIIEQEPQVGISNPVQKVIYKNSNNSQ